MNTRNMRIRLWLLLAILAVACTIVSSAQASTAVNVTFQAQDFLVSGGSDSPPADPIIGSFSFSHPESSDFTGWIDSLTLLTLDLTVDGHSYGLSDTSLDNVELNGGQVEFFELGGILEGLHTVSSGNNDFQVAVFDPVGHPSLPVSMWYATSGTDGLYMTENVVFSSSTVPIPDAAWLFGSALAGLAGWVRRRA